MPKFLVEATYTAEGHKGLAKDKPSGRKTAITQAVKKLGGKLDAIYGSEQETVRAYPFIEFGSEPVPVAALESGKSSPGPQCFRTVERC